jgi:uncharacterized protein
MEKYYIKLFITLIICILFVSFNLFSQQPNKHFLWKIESDKGTAYLLGSIHVAKDDMYPLDTVIENAFKRSDALVVEANITQIDPSIILEKIKYNDGTTLKDHLSPDVYNQLKEAFKKKNIPEYIFNTMKPFFAITSLMVLDLVKDDFSAANGIDMHFMEKAKNKKILELESVDFQIGIFDKFSREQNDAFVKYSLIDMDSTTENLDSIFVYWKNVDTAGINRLINEPKSENPQIKSIMKLLLDKRNLNMAVNLEGMIFGGGTYFVVVGAGHLFGDTGIINILKKTKKYRITQM